MNVLDAFVQEPQPYSGINVQRVEGGFLCMVPPGPPVAAEDGNDAGGALFTWLGVASQPTGKSSVAADQLSVGFDGPKATCPIGSVFQASKIKRVNDKGAITKRGAFFLTYHGAQPGTGQQVIVFSRPNVMEHFRKWLILETPAEGLQAGLLKIQGMRVNTAIEAATEGVFNLEIELATGVPSSPAPYVARRIELPTFEVGVSDANIVHYIAACLGQDSTGVFLSRVHEAFLEFGPRVEDGDDGDKPVLPVGPDPSNTGTA